MDAVATMLHAVARDPGDDTAWLALADGLAEAGQEARAELVRVQLALRQESAPDADRLERRLKDLWSAGVEPCQPTRAGPFGMSFVLVPPGSFAMGAPPDERWRDPDELPRRRVTLTRGLWVGATPVTRRQWRALMGQMTDDDSVLDHPVTGVSRPSVQGFCERLGEILGWQCRLPSEAEWEYACRAGTSGLFCSGDEIADLRLVGWCSYDGEWDSSGGTQRVGELRGNAWGLFDMHGNVWEWCADWYDPNYYESAPGRDPRGPARGTAASVRGGSYRGGPWFCRSAERRGVDPEPGEVNVGFRVVVEA